MDLRRILKTRPMSDAPDNGKNIMLELPGGRYVVAAYTCNEWLRRDFVVDGELLVEAEPSIEDCWITPEQTDDIQLNEPIGWLPIADEDNPDYL